MNQWMVRISTGTSSNRGSDIGGKEKRLWSDLELRVFVPWCSVAMCIPAGYDRVNGIIFRCGRKRRN